MTFTDDDLKRLKDYIKRRDGAEEECCEFFVSAEALLARLEAAEQLAHQTECGCMTMRDGTLQIECGRHIAWRKAAGK